jgi:phosphatidylethanolamine-binding protein (PEBP) family uncharacterized protein
MAPPAQKIKIEFSRLGKNASTSLRVHYPGITVENPGATVSRATTSQMPTLSISSKVPNLDVSKRYIAICLDPDAPYPSMPVMGPIAHGIQGDLQLGSTEEPRGWLRLNATAKPVLPYLPPSPPPLSSPHRYLFLLWEQPEGLSGMDIRTRLELPEEPGMMARVKWDQVAFEEKIGLGMVLASTYFLCS